MAEPEASRRRQRRAEHCRSIARIGGLTTSANYDPVARTATARAVFASSFEREIRAKVPGLPDAEYARRATAARKLFYARLGLRSQAVRAAAKARPTDRPSEGSNGSK
jgi:hypothetical protein